MKHNTRLLTFTAILVSTILAASACSPLAGRLNFQANLAKPGAQAQSAATPTPAPQSNPAPISGAASPDLLSAYEGTLNAVYDKVNPSVVSIDVLLSQSAQVTPDGSGSQAAAQGSGFVWDQQGHVVTNNHVVDGSTQIEVVFYDGSRYPASVVGKDPGSDLAVIKVDAPADFFHPVELGDSSQVKIGQVAIAIGNPFGLSNTMTVGIISALGRSLPADMTTSSGASYSNPDLIQTDASINPGNSGGVLVDQNGKLIGIPSAIESPVRANSGVGFAVPSNTVARVIPELIAKGSYSYAWLGVSGSELVPQLAEAMKLPANQRGVLVGEVTAGGPAAKAGLIGSTQSTTIDGLQANIGGDVITAIDGQAVKTMDDLIAYLADSTRPGQEVKLSILRDGKASEVTVTLGTRPVETQSSAGQIPNQNTPQQGQGQNGQQPSNQGAYLGVSAVEVNADIISEMKLPAGTSGVLVQEVGAGSPAEQSGIKAGTRAVTIQGSRILLDGDIITAIDGQSISSVQQLRASMRNYKPGDQIKLTILRQGQPLTLNVTLAQRPNN